MSELPDYKGIPGWLSDKEAEALFTLAHGRIALEVGSYCGRSSVCIASSAELLVCVDPFDGRSTIDVRDTWHEFSFNIAYHNLRNVFAHRTTFENFKLEGSRKFNFAFIDAEHTREAIIADSVKVTSMLEAYSVLCYHDYAHPNYPDVKSTLEYLYGKPHAVVDSLAIYFTRHIQV